MFNGLCAFPLTPLTSKGVDDKSFIKIIFRLTDAKVDSLGILGLTSVYCLPQPIQPLSTDDIAEIANVIKQLNLE